MDMYQKRKIRQEMKNNENKKEKQNQTNINWYPGHMAKTRRQIIEDLKLIDVVVEILDARIPISSQNPDIQEITKNKKKIILLNKSDLADEKETAIWIKKYKESGVIALSIDANTGRGVQEVNRQIEKIMQEELQENAKKGRVGRKIRVMILGIPNVGKSSLINRMANKNSTIVGNKPGVTKQKQWIRVNEKIELLDTPGVLWPKLQSETVALNLAYTGTIKDDVLDKVEVAYYLLKYLLENYLDNLVQRYKLEMSTIEKVMRNENLPQNENIMEIFYLIGRKRGAIVSGGQVDEKKVANIIIEDFRTTKLGKITLEKAR